MGIDTLTPEERYPEAWLFVQLAQRCGQQVADELWQAYQKHQSVLRERHRLRHELQKLERRLERLRQAGTSPSFVERLEQRRAIWQERLHAYSYVGDQVLLLLRGDDSLSSHARETLIKQVQQAYAQGSVKESLAPHDPPFGPDTSP